MIFRVLWFGGHQIVDSLLGLGGIRRVVADVVGWVLEVFFHGNVCSYQFSSVLRSCSSNFTSFVLVGTAAKRNSVFHEGPLFFDVDFFASVTVVPMRINICYRIVAHKLSKRPERILSRVSLHDQGESIRPKLRVRFKMLDLQFNCWLL